MPAAAARARCRSGYRSPVAIRRSIFLSSSALRRLLLWGRPSPMVSTVRTGRARRARNAADGLLAAPAEIGPQRFVPAHDVVDRLRQLAWIERPMRWKAKGRLNSGRPGRFCSIRMHLVLRDRERGRPAFSQPREACLRRLARLCRHGLVDPPGKLVDRRCLEDGLDRQRHAERAGDARHAWPASSEWPPRSKKLSVTPRLSTFSRSIQMSDSTFSVKRRAGTAASGPAVSCSTGASSADRSILPWALSGTWSRNRNADGMAWPGSRLFRKSRSSLALLRLPDLRRYGRSA